MHRESAVIQELSQYEQTPEVLEGMIMQNAAHFNDTGVIKMLHRSRAPWLVKALLQVKADSG